MFATIRRAIRENGQYRLGRWDSFWGRFTIGPWRWSFKLCKFEDHWSLHFFCLWIRLWATKNPPEDMMESWGWSYYRDESALHLSWGSRYKILRMPWSYDHCRTEVMLNGGQFVPYDRFPARQGQPFSEAPEPEGRYRETFAYHYTLRSGQVQERTATVTVERRSWCWKVRPFRWLRWPRMVRTSIDVQFSDEVGEETGSWKGGCVGTGHEMKPGERPVDTLRRMERERKF